MGIIFIENAIKYGMQTSSMPLKIRIKATVSNGTLTLEVWNSGKWIEPSSNNKGSKNGTRTGLENIRRRLENAFPET